MSQQNALSTAVVTEENYVDVIREIEDAFFDIPFENSSFQTEAFVISSQITPARAYRAIGLRMNAKLRALEEAKYGRMKEDIDIEELYEKINDPATSKWDRKRAQIDVEQKLAGRRFTDKLINDALQELNVLYRHFKALPRYTREEFEKEERLHFEQRLQRQIAGIEGAKESLVNMIDDMRSINAFEKEVVEALANNQPISIEDARAKSLTNFIQMNVMKEEQKS
jgi:hypothetical protein